MQPMLQTYGGEIVNPFFDAKWIGDDYSNKDYIVENSKRGDKEFVVSRSMLLSFAANPHKWRAGHIRKTSSALALGSIMDCIVLQPASFEKRYALQPATYYDEKSGEEKKWNGNATVCKKWRAEHEDKLPCKQIVFEGATAARDILMQDELVKELLEISRFQVRVDCVYVDSATGLEIPVKTMIDGVPDAAHKFFGKSLWDYKSANSVDNTKWRFSVDTFHYDAQAALELAVYQTLTPNYPRTEFFHIGQESFPPFEVGRKFIDGEFIDLGLTKILYALANYCRCLKDNNWPGTDDQAHDTISGWTRIKPTAPMIERAKQAIPSIEEPPEEVSQKDDDFTP